MTDMLSQVVDDLHDHVALARMSRRRLPKIHMAWSFDSGEYAVQITVDGVVAVTETGASLDSVARKCRVALTAWTDEQNLQHALAVTLAEVRAEKRAGGR